MTNQSIKIFEALKTATALTRGQIADIIYGRHVDQSRIYVNLEKLVKEGYVIKFGAHPAYYSLSAEKPAPQTLRKNSKNANIQVPYPTIETVRTYIDKWETLDGYVEQEKALDKLFFLLCPKNSQLEDVLIKCSALNDFYSTNIFKVYNVAVSILKMDIDKRLEMGELDLVNDIADSQPISVYSFATKYCSHHKPDVYPIYDNYVQKILLHYRDKTCFCEFSKEELRDYPNFVRIIMAFRRFFGLESYTVKEIDKYLWQVGKEYFPKKWSKKQV